MSGTNKAAAEEMRDPWNPVKFVEGDVVGKHEAALIEDDEIAKFFDRKQDVRDFISLSLGLYAFTTEDILAYLPLLDAKDKRCLTVAASGDQAINLLMAGAKEIVAFDNVAAAGEVTWYKLQALADLPWRDRGHFRGKLWRESLQPLQVARMRDRVWSPAYYGGRSAIKGVIDNIKPPDAVFRDHISGINAYIETDEAFETAREAAKQAMNDGRVSFLHTDVRGLPLHSLGEFDVIVLSNILQAHWEAMSAPYRIARDSWAERRHGADLGNRPERLKALIDQMIWPIAHMLAPGGVMMASYTYACEYEESEVGSQALNEDEDDVGHDPIRIRRLREAAFAPPPGFSVEEHSWQTVNSVESGEDVCVIIRRDR